MERAVDLAIERASLELVAAWWACTALGDMKLSLSANEGGGAERRGGLSGAEARAGFALGAVIGFDGIGGLCVTRARLTRPWSVASSMDTDLN